MKRVFRRTCAMTVAATVATFGFYPAGTSVSSAAPFTTPPTDDEFADLWVNPQARTSAESALQLSVRKFSPPMPTTDGAVSVSVEITNTSTHRLIIGDVTAGVGDAIPDASSARLRLADRQSDRSVNLVSRDVDHALKAGDSTTVRLTLPLDALNPGLYQLTISAVGQRPARSAVGNDMATSPSTISGQARVLMPLRAPTPSEAAAKERADATSDDNRVPTTPPVEFTMLWPLAAPTHIVGGETGQAPEAAPLMLSDDQLADELRPQGRLSGLLDAYQAATQSEMGSQFRSATCLAIDPSLVSTVERMTHGYTISDTRPNPVKVSPRLRDSWFDTPDSVGRPGSGVDDARVWLEKLQAAAKDSCVVPLPSSVADLNAVARTGNSHLVAQSVIPGAATLERIVHTPVVRNVMIPGSGYLTEATANVYSATGRPADSAPNPDPPFDATLGQLWSGSTPVSALVANNTLHELPGMTAAGAGAHPSAGADGAAPSSAAPSSAAPSASSAPVFTVPTQLSTTSIAAPRTDTPNPPTSMRVITFNAELAATLAATGNRPTTAAYSAPISRYQLNLDSPTARIENAIGVLWQQTRYRDPIVAVPPADWSIDNTQAATFTSALEEMFQHQQLRPQPLTNLLAAPAQGSASLSAPYPDPGELPDVEVQRASQQAQSIEYLRDLMVNDSNIALTREHFVAPLRQGLLRALSTARRRQYSSYDAVAAQAEQQLHHNDETLRELISSVSLLTPGNVFSRSSNNAPLLIVARNGLPLPVPAVLASTAPDGVHVRTVDQLLPAKGSITLQVSVDVPPEAHRTDLQLWLATPAGAKISDEITVALQPPPGMGKWGAVIVLVLLIGIGVVAQRIQQRRRGVRRERRKLRTQPRAPNRPPHA